MAIDIRNRTPYYVENDDGGRIYLLPGVPLDGDFHILVPQLITYSTT